MTYRKAHPPGGCQILERWLERRTPAPSRDAASAGPSSAPLGRRMGSHAPRGRRVLLHSSVPMGNASHVRSLLRTESDSIRCLYSLPQSAPPIPCDGWRQQFTSEWQPENILRYYGKAVMVHAVAGSRRKESADATGEHAQSALLLELRGTAAGGYAFLRELWEARSHVERSGAGTRHRTFPALR